MCPVSCPAPVVEMGTTPRFPHFLATAFSSGKWAGNLQLEGQMGHVGNHYQHTGAVPLTDYELVSLKVCVSARGICPGVLLNTHLAGALC